MAPEKGVDDFSIGVQDPPPLLLTSCGSIPIRQPAMRRPIRPVHGDYTGCIRRRKARSARHRSSKRAGEPSLHAPPTTSVVTGPIFVFLPGRPPACRSTRNLGRLSCCGPLANTISQSTNLPPLLCLSLGAVVLFAPIQGGSGELSIDLPFTSCLARHPLAACVQKQIQENGRDDRGDHAEQAAGLLNPQGHVIVFRWSKLWAARKAARGNYFLRDAGDSPGEACTHSR